MQKKNWCFKAYGAEILLILLTMLTAEVFWLGWTAFDGGRAAIFYVVAMLAEIVGGARLQLLKDEIFTFSYNLVFGLCWTGLAAVICVGGIVEHIGLEIVFVALTAVTAIWGAIISRIMSAVLWTYKGHRQAEDDLLN